MEPSRPFDPQVLALGRRLVESLREDGRDDSLSAWMAHHIASLMVAVASAPSTAECEEARAHCMDAILKLWDHRGTLPGEARPFGKAQAALEFLVRLDPHSKENLFFRMRPNRPPGKPENDWLVKAEAVDDATRVLIRHCLKQAFMGDAAELSAWVELAPQIDPAESQPDVSLVAALVNLMRDGDNGIKAGSENRLIASIDVMLKELETLRDRLNADSQG